MSRPLRIAVLASGKGSNLQAIIDAIESRKLNASIVLVISDKQDAYALQRAKEHKITYAFLDPKQPANKKEFEAKIAEKIKQQDVDLLVLAGWMRILGKTILEVFKNRIINIHPSLLPAFPGLDAQMQALEYGVKYTGCTVHFVDSGIDTGPIIAQRVVPVLQDDTVATLSERILGEEHLLYPSVIQLFSEKKVYKEGRKVRIKED